MKKEKRCIICSKPLIRGTTCRLWCEPTPGLMITCSCCGESKPYESFFDYRGTHADGKFRIKCRECVSKTVHKRVEKGNCAICGEKIVKKHARKTCGGKECMRERGLRTSRERKRELWRLKE